ncbi:MAG: hypothetical protein RRY33_08660, partial [Alistipes sp.]
MILHFNNTTLDLTVDDNSYRYREIKGSHAITLYFSLPQHVEIPVGAYCEFEGETYTLEEPENFKMRNSRNFEYTLTLESAQAKLKKYRFRNPLDGQLKFSLTANPQDHLKMLVDNLNRRDSGWSIGMCITSVEKVISYNHTSCDAALSQMADAFETEWEVVGKTISLHKVEYNKTNPLPLSYGKGKGFRPDVGRVSLSDKRPIEILFVQGGDRNIDKSKYGSKELLLPKAQTLIYEGRTYVTDAEGLSLQRADKPLLSHTEDSLDCSQIYPSRVGSVTKVETTKEGFCDFLDTTIPEALDYSKYRIAGEKMTIIFQSGMLSGKEFDIQQEEKSVSGYVHTERRFKIVEQEVDGEPMPKGNYMPVVGDTYAVFGMMLPDAYICDNTTKTGASWDLFREGAKYLYENEDQQFTFTGELDSIWAKKDWLNIGGRIKLGGYILFSDPQFQIEGVGIRIVGIKDYINNPHSPELELSNSVVGSSIMSDLRKIESNEVMVDDLHRDALQFTKRRFRDAKETTEMLEKAMLNFTGGINPISVQTMQLLLGDESLQYRFVNGRQNPQTVAHEVVYTPKTKVLTVKAGTLQHMTLGVKTLSSIHKANEYKFWDISLFNTPPLTEGVKKYYLYAKVSATTQSGEFRISETAIGIREVAGYYHLLVGFLNSEYDGDRSFVPMYGFAELTPGRLTIPRIVSADGKTYFDLERGEIGGCITFINSSGTSVGLADFEADNTQKIADAKAYAEAQANAAKRAAIEAATADNAAAVADYNTKFAQQQAQIDGEVSNWYGTHSPTLTNTPANAWKTDLDRDRHLGDTFLNSTPYIDDASTPDAGKAWRFTKNGTIYSWNPISDSDAVKALQQAAKAQATADGKSTTYYEKPTSYAYGDTWVLESDVIHAPNKKGELLFASQGSASYNATHWGSKLRYTDDSAANEAKDRLNKWADDAVISPTEKAALRNERTSVAGEKEIVVANAVACKVSTVDFLASWNLYDAELVYHSTAAPENIPIRPAFATTQSGYYAAKKTIAAQITAAQQQATIGNTEAASAATKDALAKELGYTDFATMKAAAAADKTIIDGGHLRTALIDVDNLVAKQVDVVNGASRVKITPELGLILLENNIETATFSGEQASSINSIVPEVASIPITEQHIVIRSTNMDVEPNGRRYMASGSIARTSNALVVEIPAITLYSALYCSNDYVEPNPIDGWMQICVNGGVAKEMQFASRAFVKESYQNGFDQEGYPIYDDRYRLNQVDSRSFPAQSISIPAKTASSTSAPITVEFSYGFGRGSQAGNVSWDIDLYAKFGNNPAANAPVTTNLRIGGTAFNASFFGNGVLFSKAIDQYVGMLSTPTGTELIARNGNRGFKFD